MRVSIALHGLGFAALALAQAPFGNVSGYSVSTPPLTTPWTYTAGINPWPEYPRPQLERSQWQNLNGIWRYQNTTGLDALNNPPFNQTLANAILIPSCVESGLSGIQGRNALYSWFSTSFTVPSGWSGQQVLLNFGAVDYEATVFVNGQNATFHRGGYFAFTVDITSYLNGGVNELLVFGFDPTDSGDYVIPIGKQTLHPSHIFYTPCSGIWQSVWIEAAPANYITQLQISADMAGQVNATVSSSGSNATSVQIAVIDNDSGATVATQTCSANMACVFNVPSVRLWSPNCPTLYNMTITMGNDVVHSYAGFRTVGKGVVDGVVRPLINGEFFFQFGTLDQGFWPDGIYTPPNREAMVYDLQTLKAIGFNGLRKHIKVETALYYQACDQLGLALIQDMPSLRPLQGVLPNATQQDEFTRQLELLVVQQRNFPSIMTWVIYNEGWGQLTSPYYPEFGLTDIVRSLDPTRLIDATTGWFDHGAGDYSDNHHYANPQCGSPFYSIPSTPYDPTRIGFQGEFGGIGENVTIDHLWNVQEAIDTINQTYEIDETLAAWNYRGHVLLSELLAQTQMFSCSGGIWTQTTDVEGEVNGMLTYDRRILRPNLAQWNADISALYSAAAARANGLSSSNSTCASAVASSSSSSGPSTYSSSGASSSSAGGASSSRASGASSSSAGGASSSRASGASSSSAGGASSSRASGASSSNAGGASSSRASGAPSSSSGPASTSRAGGASSSSSNSAPTYGGSSSSSNGGTPTTSLSSYASPTSTAVPAPYYSPGPGGHYWWGEESQNWKPCGQHNQPSMNWPPYAHWTPWDQPPAA